MASSLHLHCCYPSPSYCPPYLEYCTGHQVEPITFLLSHSKLYFTNRHHHFINAYLVMISACLKFSNSSYYTQYKSKGLFFCPLWSHLLPIFPTTLNSLSFCQLLFHYKGITKQAKTCYLRAFEFALNSS